ncbi:hypothetical protein JHK85_033534 [Glycine max]|nr:hypothetical protein JHK85_033534 [Glycine max]
MGLPSKVQTTKPLVNIWSRELTKLREKEQSLNSAATQHQEMDKTSSGFAVIVAKLMQFNKPRFLFSEASISMLVECFNP